MTTRSEGKSSAFSFQTREVINALGFPERCDLGGDVETPLLFGSKTFGFPFSSSGNFCEFFKKKKNNGVGFPGS